MRDSNGEGLSLVNALHGGKWLDSFTAIEAVEAIADWFAGPFT